MERPFTARIESPRGPALVSERDAAERGEARIWVRGLSKAYGETYAVRDVSLRGERGEILGFLGQNGAGKTTTFRMLAGTLAKTAGDVWIAGYSQATHPIQAKRHLGYLPEAPALYPELTALEYLKFRAGLLSLSGSARNLAISTQVERTQLQEVLRVSIGHLSKGFRQRVGLAAALLGKPSVLLLDEPSSGLDPAQIQSVRELLKSLAREEGVTILLSTHILAEVEASCDRALIIERGRILVEGSLNELKRNWSGPRIELWTPQAAAIQEEWIAQLGLSVSSVREAGEKKCWSLAAHQGTSNEMEKRCSELLRLLISREIEVFSLTEERTPLERIFAEATVPQPEAK